MFNVEVGYVHQNRYSRIRELLQKIKTEVDALEKADDRRIPRGQLVAAVLAAVSRIHSAHPSPTFEFTAFQVKKEIENVDGEFAARVKDSSLSAILARIDTVKIGTRGAGRRPTRFRFAPKSGSKTGAV
jgi:polyisoprenoid-binding protein YceI